MVGLGRGWLGLVASGRVWCGLLGSGRVGMGLVPTSRVYQEIREKGGDDCGDGAWVLFLCFWRRGIGLCDSCGSPRAPPFPPSTPVPPPISPPPPSHSFPSCPTPANIDRVKLCLLMYDCTQYLYFMPDCTNCTGVAAVSLRTCNIRITLHCYVASASVFMHNCTPHTPSPPAPLPCPV